MVVDKSMIGFILASLGLLLIEEEEEFQRCRRSRIRKKRRNVWNRQRLLPRLAPGCYSNLCRELTFESEDLTEFVRFSRLFPVELNRLVELVSPFIQRQNTNFKDCISPGKRLVVTLRFLETGEYDKWSTNTYARI